MHREHSAQLFGAKAPPRCNAGLGLVKPRAKSAARPASLVARPDRRRAQRLLLQNGFNLGVSLDVLNDAPPWRSRGWRREIECDFRQRIGQLHTGEDHWWKVRSMRATQRIVKDLVARRTRDLGGWTPALIRRASLRTHCA